MIGPMIGPVIGPVTGPTIGPVTVPMDSVNGESTSTGEIASKAWMIIFTDLVSLLLTFFIMLFSMSNLKLDDWNEMIDTLSQSFTPVISNTSRLSPARYNISSTFKKRAINLDYLSAVLEDALVGDPILENSFILRTGDRLVIILPGDYWFEPGKAALTERSRNSLFHLGSVLRNVGNEMAVNGYVGSETIDGEEFGSGWGLSLARAVTVGSALKQAGYRDGIAAMGYSKGRTGLLDGLTPEQRKLFAKRVDIVVKPNVAGGS